MCGIFALFQTLYPSKYFTLRDSLIKNFNYGQSRGPEFSTMKQINDNVLFGFHRLAINGLDETSNQPICVDGIYLICNGEIYNYKSIYTLLNIKPITNSDCESIIHMYKRYGIEYTLQNLDGVFAFALYDSNTNEAYIARDPFGVRPMYYGRDIDGRLLVFSSLLKQVTDLCDTCENFRAGTYLRLSLLPGNKCAGSGRDDANGNIYLSNGQIPYTTFNYNHNVITNTASINSNELYSYYLTIYNTLSQAVKKRVITMERNLACLLSGGLDSSLITALVSKFVPKGQLQTYSIGMFGGSDLSYARMVSRHINSKHTEIILTEHEFFDAIREVIYHIESYDTTTVRASVGNYLVAKYISEHSDAKVIFNGDGSDELTGGYMYFHNCPSDIEFDNECKRLLTNIQYYDVLRSDRCISCHGLEARTPFLDRTFVHEYLSIPISIRNHNNDKKMEKYLLRKAVETMEPELLPHSVLWRSKEAFSDGVSSQENSWYEIIQTKLDTYYSEEAFLEKINQYTFNPPTTKEQLYYREIFESHYKNRSKVIPAFWMPRYSNVSDSSARKLDFYKKKHNIVKQCSLTIETNLSNDVYVDADSDESIGIDMDS
jgi:asparagine synthase (glutamine-hydrolysing)